MAENINMTYDALFDILRYEKSHEELQKLDENFFKDVIEYIQNKEILMNLPDRNISETEKTRIQLQNVKKLLTELYERREKKIIALASYQSKTSSSVIKTETILNEEKPIFDALVSIFSKNRIYLLNNLLNAREINTQNSFMNIHFDVCAETKNESVDSIFNKNEKFLSEDKSIKSIRFVKAVPKFLGPELETYGPFEEEDMASLPCKIANILIRKGKAEEVET